MIEFQWWRWWFLSVFRWVLHHDPHRRLTRLREHRLFLQGTLVVLPIVRGNFGTFIKNHLCLWLTLFHFDRRLARLVLLFIFILNVMRWLLLIILSRWSLWNSQVLLVLQVLRNLILLIVLTFIIKARRRLVERLNIHGFSCMHSLLIKIDVIQTGKVLSCPNRSTWTLWWTLESTIARWEHPIIVFTIS